MSRSRPLPSHLRTLVPAALVALLAAGSFPPGSAVATSPAVSVDRAPIPFGAADGDAADHATDTEPAPGSGPRATPAPSTAPVTPGDLAAAAETVGQHPSTAYEQAMLHAGDRIAFEPGTRVAVGFTPRAGDRWPVDGKAPGALPAGRATGRQMAATGQGIAWADVTGPGSSAAPARAGATPDPSTAPVDPTASTAPVDAPAGDPVTPAAGASWTNPAPRAATEPAAAAGLTRQVFGFLPYWEVSGAASRLNYDVLSTIAYFSVGADGNGNLRKRNSDGSLTTGWGGWTSSSLTSVIDAAHAHGTRVVLTLSVFAWTTSQTAVQQALLGSAAARLNFAQQAAAAVRDRGADGVNLDFEPLATGYADQFVALLKTMRSELNKVGAGYQLTYDTTGYIGNYPLEASVAAGAADAIFIMGYDYRIADSTYAGSIDPLSGPGYDLTDTVRSYTARVSPSRVILGIPWYGRAWSTVSNAVRSRNQSGLQYGYSAAVNYETVVDYVAQYGRLWDPVEQSPYVVYQRQNCTSTYGCVTSWRQIYYDDADSMQLRLALVNDYGLRGAGMWALGYDGGHPELYRAISESFLVDKAAPQAGIRILPATELAEGFPVEWTARDASGVASYDVEVSTDGGAWTAWLTGTGATTAVWIGQDGHGYAFRVRATDVVGQTGAWNVTSTWNATPSIAVGGFGRVVRDGLTYRTGPDTSSAQLGTLPAGTIVALTGGPIAADGYTWYEVTQPIAEWSPVSFVERGVWVAVRSSTSTYVEAYRAPNSTLVNAGIGGLDFGAGGATGPDKVALRSFSPNGDGSGDTLLIRWTTTLALDSLTLNVLGADGTLVGTRALSDLATGDRSWAWDGMLGGVPLPDGTYLVQLVGSAAGRTYVAPSALPASGTQVGTFGITIDTVAPAISSASASTPLISPNGDGRRDAVGLALTASDGVAWAVEVTDAAGTKVRTSSGAGSLIAFTWAGTADTGALVPDGPYTATLGVIDAAGNVARRGFPVNVDTVAPSVVQTASLPIFSPNGDHTADTTLLGWTASEAATGTARLSRGTTIVRSWTGSGLTAWSAAWNGRTAAGSAVPDGRYAFRVDLLDAAGNRTVVSRIVTVDRTAGGFRWSRAFYPQDGDSLLSTSTVTFTLTRTATTTLRLYDAAGGLVRTVWTNRALAAGKRSWTWTGKLANGSWAPQGRYTASLTVTTALGTQTLTGLVRAAAFVATPSASTLSPGALLTLRFTSVEPLSTRPRVTFTQPGRAPVVVSATRLADGSYRASLRVAAGPAGAASLRITARDTGGRTNAMTLPVTIAP